MAILIPDEISVVVQGMVKNAIGKKHPGPVTTTTAASAPLRQCTKSLKFEQTELFNIWHKIAI